MRGYMYTLESVLAVILVFSFLIIVTGVLDIGPGESELSEKAYELLKGLDEQGRLRGYAVTQDYEGLDSEIVFYATNHSVQICDSAGCVGPLPNASRVAAGTYVIAGNNSYTPYHVRLYLWS
jgi:hypothetical protein